MFDAIGCAACHVPSLETGPRIKPLFDRRTVPLYSDLLLHAVGTGDSIRQASAAPNESAVTGTGRSVAAWSGQRTAHAYGKAANAIEVLLYCDPPTRKCSVQ